ncbi:hypothetical protein QVD17_19154 [Tagetes erecta]|uniref:Uncharacterized protein n=1 Tax=Tagetes erecta TaxID=13708 RepID=A0AAD8KIZ7_TARER|nr:hypothetical protein QVD17_19154 [Tagetes erecta]
METQLMTPSPPISTNTTPYTTAPSSPHRFPSFFYSAPTSPIHSLVSFQHDDDQDFAFNFTGNLQPPSISAADELFHAGIIRPLKPISNHSPNSETNNKNFIDAFHQTPGEQTQSYQNSPKRGRDTAIKPRPTNKTPSRSSSPFRISDILSDEDHNRKNYPTTWYSKWNLKNLILFRSASEGSARRNKDPVVSKYSRVMKCDEEVKSSSFRSVDGCKRKMKVSAHEMHYTMNRAVAEEMRRKTYLPYKSGLFGCLGFHNNGAAVAGNSVHQISRGFASVMKQR